MRVSKYVSATKSAGSIITRSRKAAIRVLFTVALVCGLAVGIFPTPVSAASVSWDGDAGDGLWSNPVNWSGDTLPQADDYVTISGSAGEVQLDTSINHTGKITVTGSGNTIKINSGVTLKLDPALPPGDYDAVIVDNGASLINDGTVFGTDVGSPPRVYVTSSSSPDDSTFINNGTVNTTQYLLRGGPQDPTLINNGYMLTVRISTLVGSVTNNGTIDDAQLNLQFGTVNNTSSGVIVTTLTLSSMGSRLINSTVFDNYGTVTNLGKIDNEGIFNNYGTFDNTAGTFTNTCSFTAGTLGIFNNYGTFIGNPIINEGSLWDNDAGNGLWSDPLNWTNDVVPASANDIIINIVGGANTTVTVDTDITIDGQLGLRNSDGAPLVTTLLIPAGVTLTNNGVITFSSGTVLDNQGTIINNGDIRASGTAVFINAGTYTGNPVIGVSSTWDGEAGDGLWSTPLNWVGDSLPETGDYVTISGAAGEVQLDFDFTLMGIITVTGSGNTLKINSGVTLTLDPDLLPGQYDAVIVDNGASMVNDGMLLGIGADLPRVFVTSSTSPEDSTFINNGTVNATQYLLRGGPQDPTLVNNGYMHTARISTLVGSLINNDTIDDAQLNMQFGTVNNTSLGVIVTTSTLSSMGSRLINSTVFENHGTLTNLTNIENDDIFDNYGLLDNTAGTFVNDGTLNNYCSGTILGSIDGNPVNEMPCDQGPEVEAGADRTVDEGDTVSLEPATFTDDSPTDNYTASIDWGDSSPVESGNVSESGGSGNVSGSHIYPDNGTFLVTVNVSDGEDESADNFTVTVNNVPPEVNAGDNTTVYTGHPFVLDAGFTDPGVDDGPWAYTVDWGDGSPVTGNTTPVQGPDTVNGTHIYSAEGIYQVTVEVIDKDGGAGSDIVQVEVKRLEVMIDIKPGSDTNPVNLGSNGVIPVAVLNDAGFDAASVDVGTVRFGPAEAVAVHSSMEDIDGDGDDDLILHFRTQETGIGPDDTSAVLTGQTLDGVAFTAGDEIRIVPGKGDPVQKGRDDAPGQNKERHERAEGKAKGKDDAPGQNKEREENVTGKEGAPGQNKEENQNASGKAKGKDK